VSIAHAAIRRACVSKKSPFDALRDVTVSRCVVARRGAVLTGSRAVYLSIRTTASLLQCDRQRSLCAPWRRLRFPPRRSFPSVFLGGVWRDARLGAGVCRPLGGGTSFRREKLDCSLHAASSPAPFGFFISTLTLPSQRRCCHAGGAWHKLTSSGDRRAAPTPRRFRRSAWRPKRRRAPLTRPQSSKGHLRRAVRSWPAVVSDAYWGHWPSVLCDMPANTSSGASVDRNKKERFQFFANLFVVFSGESFSPFQTNSTSSPFDVND
jgi:hypothetical protein